MRIYRQIKNIARVWALICLVLSTPLVIAQASVVSAASYQPVVAPGSIATLFGSNLVPETVAGVPGSDGNYPKQIGGVTVTVGGAAADLFFVSPTQINFVVPIIAQFGKLNVVVAVGAQTTATSTVMVAPTAPAILTTDSSGTGFGSILNGFTFRSAPFTLTTPTATDAQTSTVLAVYGTGFRYAGGAAISSAPGDVSAHVTAVVTSSTGSSWSLPVLYTGPAPGYEGLDQINVQLIAGLDTTIDTVLTISTDAVPSNAVYLWLQQTPAPVVSSVVPSSASPGGTLTIMGSGFLDSSRFKFSTRQSVQMTLSDGNKVGVPILSSSPLSITISVPAYSPTHNGTYYSGPAQVCIEVDAQTNCSPIAFAITAPPPPSEPPGTALLSFVKEAASSSLAALPAGTDPIWEAAISNTVKAQIANLQQIVADANARTPQTIQVKDLSGNPQSLVMDTAAIQRIEGLLTANSTSTPNSVAARVTAALGSAASRRLMSRNAATASRCNPTESQEIDANNAYGDLQAANQIISLAGLIPFIYSIAQGCADGLVGGVAGCITGALGVTAVDAGVAYWTEQIATIVADVGLWSIESSPVFLQTLVTSPASVSLSPSQDIANFEILGNFSPSATAGTDLIGFLTSDVTDKLVSPLFDLCVPCDALNFLDSDAFQALKKLLTDWIVGQVNDQIVSNGIALSLQNLTNCPSASVALGSATITSPTNPSAPYSISLAGLDQARSSIQLRSSALLDQQLATFTASSNLLRADGVPFNPTATLGVYISNTPPSLSLDRPSYSVGGRLVISGQGFAPDASLSLVAQGGGASISLLPSLTSSSTGTFQQTTFLPNTVGSGSYTLKAIPADGSSTASASFTVLSSATAVFTMKSGALSAASGSALNLGVNQGANITITLDATRSSAGGLSISSWAWTDNGVSLGCTTSICSVSYPAAGSTHAIQLVVANSGSQSAPAAGQINITLQQSAPGPFTVAAAGPSCTGRGPGPTVTLGWSLSANASAYDIYRNGSLIAPNVAGTAYSDSGANVLAGQTYQYFIQAKNSVGTTGSNTLPVSIPANICQSSSALSSVAVTPLAVASGASLTITVSLTGPAPAGGISVSLSSSSSSALPVPPSVPVQAGQTTSSTTINAGPVQALTTVTVMASYNGVTKSSSVEVSPATGPSLTLSSVSVSPSTVTSGGFATLSVTLSGTAPLGGAQVGIQTSNSTAFPAPSNILVPAGQSTNGVPVQAGNPGTQSNVVVTASYGGLSNSASVTVSPSSSPNQMSVSPTVWQPGFTVGGAPATIGISVSSQSSGALNGTVTSSAAWLTADGHASYNFTAPESISVTASPAGMTAGRYSGILTFTAPAASNSPVTVPVTMTILTPLQITTTSLPAATWGSSYSTPLSATGGTGLTWSLQSGSTLPSNLTLSSSGLISGTLLMANSTGTYSFTVIVTDSLGRTQAANLSLTVQAPIVVSTFANGSFQFLVGIGYTSTNSISFFANGGTPPYSWRASGLPSGLSIDATSGYISGTPTQAGIFPSAVTATDSNGRSGSLTISLTVAVTTLQITTSTGQTPATLPTGKVGVAYSGYLAANGGTNTGYQWSVSGNLPPGLSGSGSGSGFQITGVPTQVGTTNFTVQVKDSSNNQAQQNFSLIINSGTPPAITTSTLTLATVGQSYSFSFTPTGGTPPYQWSFVGSSPDPGLQLTSSGTLQGTSSVPNDCPTGPDLWVGNQPPFGSFPSSYFQVRVTDAASQSAQGQFCLPAYYPAPVVNAVSPASLLVDGQSHTITISGSNFRSTTYVDGGFQPVFGGSGSLSFTLSPSATGAFGLPGGGGLSEGFSNLWIVQPYSNASNRDKGFTIYDPVPTISSVQAVLNNSTQPCTSNVYCQLIINGTGFVFSTQYQVGTVSLGSCVATSPSTPIPWSNVTTCAFSLPSAGTYTVTITNGNQQGGGSGTANATITLAH